MKRFLATLLLVGMLTLPSASLAVTNLIVCNDNCTFEHLIELANAVIKFILFDLAIPLATITIMIAGFMYVFNPTNAGKQTQAKDLLWTIVKGFVIALAAYLFIKTITCRLIAPNTAGGPLYTFLQCL